MIKVQAAVKCLMHNVCYTKHNLPIQTKEWTIRLLNLAACIESATEKRSINAEETSDNVNKIYTKYILYLTNRRQTKLNNLLKQHRIIKVQIHIHRDSSDTMEDTKEK